MDDARRADGSGASGAPPAPRATGRPASRTLRLMAGATAGLALVVALVLPRDDRASRADQQELVRTLGEVRQALHAYRVHHGEYPCQDLVLQLTTTTDASGAPGKAHGPYLRSAFQNPVTLQAAVRRVDEPGALAAPAAPGGWVYCARTGDFRADLPGQDPDGRAWFEL